MAYQTVYSSPKIPCSLIFFATIGFLGCFAAEKTQNSLGRGSSLSVEDNSDFLTSPDKSFTCGFYGVGTNAYWFSIWFTNSKEKTIVWMANRNKPVNGLGSRVSLRPDGSMVLTDTDGTTVWQTSSNSSNSIGAESAEILDSGNLVLKDTKDNVLWNSFDFPTNTLLPNQPFTKNMKLNSILGRENFGTGYYSLYFDNDNVLKLMYDGPDISSVYWPILNDRTHNNNSRIAVLDDMGNFLSSDGLQFRAADMGVRVKRRLTMDYDGNLRLYSLNGSTGSWVVTWEALMQLCLIHGICGRNGICVYTPEPKCSCPPGYEVVDTSNRHEGCKPKFKPTCSQVKLVQIPQVAFAVFALNHSEFISFDSCRKLCLEDCLCQAFSYRLTGGGSCYTKSALYNGYKSPTFPGSIYLRLPLSMETSVPASLNISTPCMTNETKLMLGKSSTRVRWAYLYSFASVLGAVEFLFIGLGWWLFSRRRGAAAPLEAVYNVISSQFRVFCYSELKKATKNFKEELGRGGSGAVYKGVLVDERVVAVKKLVDNYQSEDVFWAEVRTIGKINHMNLVRTWGFCSEDNHKFLISEYIENGSLDKHLFPQNFLGWKERFKIAVGVAKGLAYLHHECLDWVIHCDVKPENILLDSHFEPKIADFGLAKLSQRGSHNSISSRVRGTKGYMAPEWVLNIPITAHLDVYSYGVVILEIVKGIRLSHQVEDGVEQEAELTRFVRVAKRKIQCGEDAWIEDMLDPRLAGQFSRNQAAKMVEIGVSCVEEDRSKRPTMDSVVQSLLDCEDESYMRSPNM